MNAPRPAGPEPTPNAASAPCTRCDATPEKGQTVGCGECEGILEPLASPESYADRLRGFGSNVKPVRQP